MTNTTFINRFYMGRDSQAEAFIMGPTTQAKDSYFSLNSQGIAQFRKRPAFSAYLSKSFALDGFVDESEIVNFAPDKVLSNVGGHYNSSSGKFTAPVSGHYQFECKMASVPLTGIISLVVDKLAFPVIKAPGGSRLGEYTFSSIWTVPMEAMQTAQCTLQLNSKFYIDTAILGSQTVARSTFSGYLL